MTCAFCRKPIDPHGKSVYRRVSGFERVRQSGEGVHPLKSRIFSGEYVHALCLDIHERTGERLAQESLV